MADNKKTPDKKPHQKEHLNENRHIENFERKKNEIAEKTENIPTRPKDES